MKLVVPRRAGEVKITAAVVLHRVGYTGKEKRGQDRGVLEVDYGFDAQVIGVGRPRDDEISQLSVGAAEAETTEIRVLGGQ